MANTYGDNVLLTIGPANNPTVVSATNPIPISGTLTPSGTTAVTSAAQDPAYIAPGGTTAPAKAIIVEGKTNDGTAQYQPIPLGAGGRSTIVEGFATGTAIPVALAPTIQGGWATSTPLVSANTTNATVVKNAAGKIGGWIVSNNNAAVAYLKFYNKATTPVPASDTPILVIPVPGNTSTATGMVEFANGVACSAGISFALTTGISNTDNTAVAANQLMVNVLYQ